VAFNCLDRHVHTQRRDKVAILWEGESGESKTVTYAQLHREVCRFANALRHLGIKKGDRVAISLPMIPELSIAMLACARIGAVHSVIFSRFSPESLGRGSSIVVPSFSSRVTIVWTAEGFCLPKKMRMRP